MTIFNTVIVTIIFTVVVLVIMLNVKKHRNIEKHLRDKVIYKTEPKE